MTQNSETAENKNEKSNGGWIQTLTFAKSAESENGEDQERNKDHIRQMFIKKRSKVDRLTIESKKRDKYESDTGRDNWVMTSYDKYQIVCISGASTINVVELRRDGKVTIKSCSAKAPGRIMRF